MKKYSFYQRFGYYGTLCLSIGQIIGLIELIRLVGTYNSLIFRIISHVFFRSTIGSLSNPII